MMNKIVSILLTLFLVSCQTKNQSDSNTFSGIKTIYNKNGTIQVVFKYKEGQLNGEQILNYDNGYRYSMQFRDMGRIKGNVFYWYNKGPLMRIENYNNDGKLDSLFIQWFDNGNLELFGFFDKGKKVGKWKQFYDNGSVSIDGNFSCDGKFDGIWYYYDTNGNIAITREYSNGELLKSKVFKNIAFVKMTPLTISLDDTKK